VKQGAHLLQAAQHLIQGGFTPEKLQDARQLWGGAQSFFKSLKHMNEPQEEGVGEEYFQEDWKSEHKRVFMVSRHNTHSKKVTGF
jgi:metacaspase-1